MRGILVGIGMVLLASAAQSQTLASRVNAVRDGTVRFEYASAPGVCGNGRGNVQVQREGRGRIARGEFDRAEWADDCEPGPVRVAIDVEGGRPSRLRAYVGGRWRGDATRDLGEVPAAQAVDYLMSLAESGPEAVAKEAIFPTTIGNVEPPYVRLLAVAKDDRRPRKIRNDAVFWVGQGAAEVATKGLQEIVDDPNGDREVRKSAVFAMSQQPAAQAIPALIRIAKANRDPELRRSAIFWLGQSGDARALAYFEELLISR